MSQPANGTQRLQLDAMANAWKRLANFVCCVGSRVGPWSSDTTVPRLGSEFL
jgi:hypothetical protein